MNFPLQTCTGVQKEYGISSSQQSNQEKCLSYQLLRKILTSFTVGTEEKNIKVKKTTTNRFHGHIKQHMCSIEQREMKTLRKSFVKKQYRPTAI